MQLGVYNFFTFGLYSLQVSWANPDTPLLPITDPRTAFSRMFGLRPDYPPNEVEARKTMRTSILDRVLDRSNDLRSRLSAVDQKKLDRYETAVRELELQIERLTFMQGPSGSGEVYTHLGLTIDDHSLSHNSWFDDPIAKADRTAMQAWQLEKFAAFIQKLADSTDFDGGDLLSNTICVFTSEFGEGNLHIAFGDYGVPIGIGGGENTGIVQGLHRAVGPQSHANVWLALLNHLGIEQDTFGMYGTQPVDLTTSV